MLDRNTIDTEKVTANPKTECLLSRLPRMLSVKPSRKSQLSRGHPRIMQLDLLPLPHIKFCYPYSIPRFTHSLDSFLISFLRLQS